MMLLAERKSALSRRSWPLILLIGAAFLMSGCGKDHAHLASSSWRIVHQPIAYQYEKTRSLVRMVNDAAALVSKEGKKAFTQFSEKGSRWYHDGIYLFIYDDQGHCRFQPIPPCQCGHSYLNLKGPNGKPLVKRMVDLTHQKSPDASGWFFYMWQNGPQFHPVWKSTYARALVTPDGQHWVIGAGLYDLPMEREFLRQRVNKAAKLLKTEGRAKAFAQFLNPASPFVFLGTYIFAMDMQGKTLVDPVMQAAGRSLVKLKDVTGKPVVKIILQKMHEGNAAWVQYKWHRPKSRQLGRKVVYVRKVSTPKGPVIVGADAFLATPIWMKG